MYRSGFEPSNPPAFDVTPPLLTWQHDKELSSGNYLGSMAMTGVQPDKKGKGNRKSKITLSWSADTGEIRGLTPDLFPRELVQKGGDVILFVGGGSILMTVGQLGLWKAKKTP